MTDSIENILQIGEGLEQRLNQIEDKLEDQINKILDLSRIGTAFTSLLDLNLILPMVMETALRIVKGEVGAIIIFDIDGEPRNVNWGLSSDIAKELKTEENVNVIDHVVNTGDTLVINDLDFHVQSSPKAPPVTINSFIIAPLKSREKVVGVISIANKEDSRAFDDDDQFSLDLLGSFAAVAISNVKFHKEALARQKIESELNLAEQVQATLMPDEIKTFDKLAVYSYHHQAGHVGGDFFDIIELGDDRYLIAVADVSNKGIPAALIMTAVRSYIRVVAQDFDNLSDLAARVNSLLCKDMKKLKNMFVTMFIALVDMRTYELYSVNAGHPPGYFFHDDKIEKLKTGGTLMGQFPEIQYKERAVPIAPGDRLLVFTDGLFECVNAGGEMLGMANAMKFMQEYSHLPWTELIMNLKKLLKHYSFDPGRVDDTTLIKVEIKK